MQKLTRILLTLCLTATVCLGGLITPVLAYANPTTVLPLALFSFAGKRPENLGANNGQLALCPNSPNCVSSQSLDSAHRIEPLIVTDTPQAAIAKLKAVITSLPRTKIIAETEDYLYAEFTSALMGYVDDVEFYVNKEKNIVEVRSASRLGESDLGVNRDRIENIRTKFLA